MPSLRYQKWSKSYSTGLLKLKRKSQETWIKKKCIKDEDNKISVFVMEQEDVRNNDCSKK